MKRLHGPQHLTAVVILTLVSGVYGWMATYDNRLGDVQVRLATVAVKDHDPSLYPNDPVFGGAGMWRGHSPLFLGALKMVLVPTEYRDLMLPFRIMVPILTLVFLLGMYALLYRQCLSWSVSVFVAVLSTTVTSAPGRSHWGIGPVASVTPTGVCLALLPLVVIGFLSGLDHYSGRRGGKGRGPWRLLVIFACVGLLGNVELGVSMNVALVLAGAYLVSRRFALRAWPVAAVCLLVAAVAALPQLGYILALRYTMLGLGTPPPASTVFEALRHGGLRALFPALSGDLLNWILSCSVLIVLAGLVLVRFERFRARNLVFWSAMFVGSLVVTVVFQGLMQVSAMLTGAGPLIIDFARATTLAMLPLYVLCAQTLTNLFRLSRGGQMLRWGCLALMVIWMLPSDNFRVVRHGGYKLGTAFMNEQDKPIRIRKRAQRRQRRTEMVRIAEWARENSSPKDIFITDDAAFRMLSRRSIVGGDDVRWMFYLYPGELPLWLDRIGRIRRMLKTPGGKADAEAIYEFATDPRQVTTWKSAEQWYVILPSEALVESDRLEPIRGPGWGEHWSLVRIVRPEGPPAPPVNVIH